MQIRAPMVIHSTSVSQGGPFGSPDSDDVWITMTSPPKEKSVLERETMGYSPPDTTINLAVGKEMAPLFPTVGTNVNVTITIEGD